MITQLALEDAVQVPQAWHGVTLKLTGSDGANPPLELPRAEKGAAMDWADEVSATPAGSTVKDWVTGAACGLLVLPDWLATIEQVPNPATVTMFPDTVQTGGVAEAKAIVKRALAVALRGNGATPNVTLVKGPNAMVGIRVARKPWFSPMPCPSRYIPPV
jgi:hypothetical protein